MLNQKGYIHIVVVVLISIMAIGLIGAAWWYEDNKEAESGISTQPAVNLYLNSNTNVNINNDTSDWQTYLNQEYKFSIKFPAEYKKWEATLSDEVRSQNQDGELFEVGFRPEQMQGSVMVVSIFSKPLSEIVKKSNIFDSVATAVTSFGAVKAYRVGYHSEAFGIDSDDYAYVFHMNVGGNETQIQVFKSILSTFKTL